MRTFYLSNVAIPQDLTEITTGLRQLLDLKRIQQINSQNAIVVRATPDQLALADKNVHDIDKAKPEVIVQIEVLQARTDRLRDLGILPGQSASIAINPNSTTTTNNNTTPSPNTVTLNQLTHLNQNDGVLTLPSATANFVLTDAATKIIQNPEIRSIDGQQAKLNFDLHFQADVAVRMNVRSDVHGFVKRDFGCVLPARRRHCVVRHQFVRRPFVGIGDIVS